LLIAGAAGTITGGFPAVTPEVNGSRKETASSGR